MAIQFEEIGNDEIKQIDKFLSSSNFFPNRYLVNKREVLIDYWKEDIYLKCQKGSKAYVGFGVDGGIKCFSLLEDLEWDSKLFNKKMGAVSYLTFDKSCDEEVARDFVNYLVAESKEKGQQFLMCKVNTDNIIGIHSLERNGFLLVDTLLDFIWDKSKNPLKVDEENLNKEVKIEKAELKDEEQLRNLAREAFKRHFGRYHSDPNIKKEDANKVYEEWISSSLKGYADYFFVAKIKDKIAGYSIWKNMSPLEKKYNLRLGHYSIAGVDESCRGMGLFKVLTVAGMRALENDVDVIEGPTHINNYPVQKGYISLGWKIGDARHSFHKWLKET